MSSTFTVLFHAKHLAAQIYKENMHDSNFYKVIVLKETINNKPVYKVVNTCKIGFLFVSKDNIEYILPND
jgi:hypothetical protein